MAVPVKYMIDFFNEKLNKIYEGDIVFKCIKTYHSEMWEYCLFILSVENNNVEYHITHINKNGLVEPWEYSHVHKCSIESLSKYPKLKW